MQERTVTIINHLGVHARAAAKFVTAASQFQSMIQLGKEKDWVDGKSIMGVMMLAAAKGDDVVIRAQGADEEDALHTLATLIGAQFGEGGENL